MATRSSTLAWRIPGTEEPGRRVVGMWFGAIPGAFGRGRAQPPQIYVTEQTHRGQGSAQGHTAHPGTPTWALLPSPVHSQSSRRCY